MVLKASDESNNGTVSLKKIAMIESNAVKLHLTRSISHISCILHNQRQIDLIETMSSNAKGQALQSLEVGAWRLTMALANFRTENAKTTSQSKLQTTTGERRPVAKSSNTERLETCAVANVSGKMMQNERQKCSTCLWSCYGATGQSIDVVSH